MICDPSWCEFWNLLFGGLIVGVLSSGLFVYVTEFIENKRFHNRFSTMKSSFGDYDWVAFNMDAANGRLKETKPNGSVANVNLNGGSLEISLKHGEREWKGKVKPNDSGIGEFGLKYEDSHEFDVRRCIIGSYIQDGIFFDYIFLVPVNSKIYYLKKISENQWNPTYEYGNEILVRRRKS